MDTMQVDAVAQHDSHSRPQAERIGLLVLGMHRSGTSALTRVLNLLGCALPERLLAANPTNPKGHWETQAIVDLNDALIEAAGSSWNDWQALNAGWEQSPARSEFLNKAVQVLRTEYENSSFFVIKDPRICRIAPFWAEVLRRESVEPRIIIPIRNPSEVVASLASRDGIEPSLGYLIWLRHVIDAERGTRGMQRIFVTYHALLEDWSAVVTRIGDSLDIRWPRYSSRVSSEIDDFLDRYLQNHKEKDHASLTASSVPVWVRQAYAIFLRWAQTSEAISDFTDLDQIGHYLDEAADAFGKPMLRLQHAAAHIRQAQNRIATLDEAEARAKDAAIHIDALKSELDLAMTRALGAENGVVERDAVIADLRQARDRVTQMEEERDEALERALSIEAAIKARSEEHTVALEKAEGRYKSLQDELDATIDMVASLKRELRQFNSDHEDAVQELKIVQGRFATALSERETALRDCAIAEQALRKKSEENAEAVAQAMEMQSALLQRKEELRQTWAELDAERARAQALDTDLARRDMLLTHADRKLADADVRIANLETECDRNRQEITRWRAIAEREENQAGKLEEARNEVERLREALSQSDRSLEQAQKDNMESRDRVAAAEAELEKTNKLARMAVSQRSQAFNEMAAVTQLLRDSEQEVARVGDSIHWLRQMYTVIMRRPRWWFFLSRKTELQRLRRRAERRGLFDSDAYLAKNPDVATSGVDPLKHYITHGIAESRPR